MSFKLQPTTLVNTIIKLQPLDDSDFERLFTVASNPKVWEQHPNPNRYKLKDFTNYFEGAIQSKGAFLILETTTNKAIGCTRFYDYNENDNSILIGYTFIGIDYWGKEYNASLKKLMLEYAFHYVNKVYFHVGATNFRSQKAIEKIGTIKIDEFEVEYFGEEPKLNYIYQITPDMLHSNKRIS